MFVNYDAHNILWMTAGSTIGYACNVCGREYPLEKIYHAKDGSRCVCKECADNIKTLLHMSDQEILNRIYKFQ